jgi:hypothetical protein
MSSTIPLPPREQLYYRSCSSNSKHTHTINRSPTSAEEQEYLEAFKAMGEHDEVALEQQGKGFLAYKHLAYPCVAAGALSEKDEKKKKRPSSSSANKAKSKSSV